MVAQIRRHKGMKAHEGNPEGECVDIVSQKSSFCLGRDALWRRP